MDLLTYWARLRKLLGYTLSAVLRPFLAHLLHLSPTSSRCDLRTAFVVSVVRAMFNDPSPVSMLEVQRESIEDPGVHGPIWVVTDEFPPPPESDVKDALYRAIKALGHGKDALCGDVDLRPVSGEWVGLRKGTGNNASEPGISDTEKYERLMQETKSNITILFMHGGQFLYVPNIHLSDSINPRLTR